MTRCRERNRFRRSLFVEIAIAVSYLGCGSGSAEGTDQSPGTTGSASRGPLRGGTSCELLASCCAQLPSSQLDNCNRDLADQDQDQCQKALVSHLAWLSCGPLLAGTVALAISPDPGAPTSFQCGSPRDAGLGMMQLAYEPATDQIYISCRSNDVGLGFFDMTLLAAVGVSQSDGSTPPRATFAYRVSQDQAFHYLPGQDVASADIATFDAKTSHVAGTFSGAWSAAHEPDAPLLTISVSFDAELVPIALPPK